MELKVSYNMESLMDLETVREREEPAANGRPSMTQRRDIFVQSNSTTVSGLRPPAIPHVEGRLTENEGKVKPTETTKSSQECKGADWKAVLH